MSTEYIFDAVRRGYNDLSEASNQEIKEYFQNLDAASLPGHLSNIKGIAFEEAYVQKLNDEGINAYLYDEVNHPLTDIFIEAGQGIGYADLQLKATDSVSYINETLESLSDTPIVVTSEIADHFDTDQIIDSGISNADLTSDVSDAILDGSDLASDTLADGLSPIPITPLGAIVGLLTGLFF